jgi:hypothetical protein
MTEGVPCSWVFWIRQMLNQFSGVVTELEPNKSEQAVCLESDTPIGNVIRVPALKFHIPISREARLTKGGNEWLRRLAIVVKPYR